MGNRPVTRTSVTQTYVCHHGQGLDINDLLHLTGQFKRVIMRSDVISLDEMYMAIAVAASRRSRDPVLQVGACVVDNYGRVKAVGYNNMPNDDNDKYPWCKDDPDPLHNKGLYVCHAEQRAIASCAGDLRGCSIYVTLHPCNVCAKLIVLSGMKSVTYLDDRHGIRYQASRKILTKSGVELKKYHTTGRTLVCKL
ncbi:deoxycytidylate deaminase-like isoform X2 [Haliotis asinina]|uniref:deoxycytidylate deaminase-like isoform X2 n=1 Tax=Haliotis asinina TaxID=109174 RepID=UPI0035327A95